MLPARTMLLILVLSDRSAAIETLMKTASERKYVTDVQAVFMHSRGRRIVCIFELDMHGHCSNR